IVDGYSGNLADICPVGALTSGKFRFRCRVWFLNSTPSICASCSTGCNIRIDHKDDVIYRIVARRNPAVNSSWICDEGRMSYERVMSTQRLTKPVIRTNGSASATTWEEAIKTLNTRLMEIRSEFGASAIAAIASPAATNEENYIFKKYITDIINSPNLDFRVDEGHKNYEKMEDHLLRRLDKNPNTRGALNLKMTPTNGGLDVNGIIAGAREGKINALLILNQDVIGRKQDADLRAIFSRIPLVAVLSEMKDETTDAAHIALPIASFAEKDGTFTNYKDRIQRIRAAVKPPGDARDATAVISELIKSAGGDVEGTTASEIFKRMASEVSEFSGLDYDKIGEEGIITGD
ncbi:MAG: molybdopterin-dependent oxidoreductase, partial [bacterium]